MKYNKYDNLLRKYKCRKKLKVYTTRLNDMNIITHNLKVFDMQAFIDTIIEESMPIYNKKSSARRAAPDVNKLVSFFILKYKIDLYNSTVKLNRNVKQRRTNQKKNTKLYRDNENTKSNCNEPVKLSFYNTDSPKTVNINLSNSLKAADHCVLSKSNITDEEYTSSENYTKLKITSKYPNETYIIIKDNYSLETDIYYVNGSNEITQHYKSKNENNKNLKFYLNGCNTIKVSHCCWYRKIFDVLLNSTIEYITKPHKCVPDYCKCCCKKYVTYVSNHMKAHKEGIISETKEPFVMSKKSESNTLTTSIQESDNLFTCPDNMNIAKLQKAKCTESNLDKPSICILRTNKSRINNLLIKPFLEPLKSLNLIKKAFSYSPLKNTNKNVMQSHKLEFLNCVIIEISHSSTNTYELYKVGPDGEIEEYYIKKLKALENSNEKQTCTLNNDGEYEKITADICCWYMRKNFIDEFRLKLLPSSLKFITSPQKYCEAKCRSCQIQLQSKIKFNSHIDLSLPGHVCHISENVNKTFNLQINFTSTMEPKSQMTKFIIENSLIVTKPINHMKTKPTATCTNKIQNAPQSLKLLSPKVKHSNTVNTVNVHQSVGANCSADSPEVKKLVSSILEKFKGVQLIVNSDGKISAQLNSSINHLNSEDIKMLIQIITQAQSELDALGPQVGNSQFRLGKPHELPQFTMNNSKSFENTIQQKLLTRKDNIVQSTDPFLHVNASTLNEEDNIIDEPSTVINNTLNDNEFSTLMKTKRDHYLNAFEIFLMTKQNTFTPSIQNLSSVVYIKKNKTTKRKAECEEDMSIKMNSRTTAKILKESKSKSNSKPEVDDVQLSQTFQNSLIPKEINSAGSVPLVSVNVDGLNQECADPLQGINKNVLNFGYLAYRTKAGNKLSHSEVHDDRNDMPGPSKIVLIPQPVAIISTPILENLLKGPASTLDTENMQVTGANILSSNTTNTSDVSGSSNTLGSELTTEITVNIHDNLFKAEPIDDDEILGV